MRMDNEFVRIPTSEEKAPNGEKKWNPSIITLVPAWFLTVFFILGGIAGFPSLASVVVFLLAIILFPLRIWQEKLLEKGVNAKVKAAILGITFAVALLLSPKSESGEKTEQSISTSTPQIESSVSERRETSAPQETPAPQSVSYINTDFDGDGYERISAELLYEYGQYMAGRKVVTVVKSKNDADGSMIHADTEGREDAWTYSINCDLNVKLPKGVINDGDAVTVAGTIAEKSAFGSTVTLKDCSIIGQGEIAQEIKDAEDYQREICERYKKSYDDAIAAAERNERENYISECVTVSYSDVERNPDNYKKTKIKVSGNVEQVIEGWFNTVTLRVKDGNGNTWVISYLRKDGESRILEGDSLTAYGECDGVTNVTNLLGQQMTYPSMDMKYFK